MIIKTKRKEIKKEGKKMTVSEFFKHTYRIVRKTGTTPDGSTKYDDHIAYGNGLRHNEDVSKYYVSPKNRTRSKKESISQPVGEGVGLAAELIRKNLVKIFLDGGATDIKFDFEVPSDLYKEGITEKVERYIVCLDYSKMNIDFTAIAKGEVVPGNMDHFHPLWKASAISTAFMLFDATYDKTARSNFIEYVKTQKENPNILDENKDRILGQYARLCVDLYHNHKDEEWSYSYNKVVDDYYSKDITDKIVQALNDGVIPEKEEQCYKKAKENNSPARPKRKKRLTCFDLNRLSDEEKALIPSIRPEWEVPKCVASIADSMVNGQMAVLLVGPAGTGKSSIIDMVCNKINLPIGAKINCTMNLDETILGKFQPREGDGAIVFAKSELACAIETGKAVVLEEINYGRPEYLIWLNSLMDNNAFVRLDNGEVIRRHPNFKLFATMNPGYSGSAELQEALFNRFLEQCGVERVPEVPVSAIKHNLMTQSWLPEEVINAMLNAYTQIKGYLKAEMFDISFSARNLVGWAKALEQYDNFNNAIFVKSAENNIIAIARENEDLTTAITTLLRGMSVPEITYEEAE